MPKYDSWTISRLVKMIDEQEVILPAMQRNFVWPEDKICALFDSVLRDYPIGTFLFWNVNKNTFKDYVFNTFIKEYDEQKGKMQRGARAVDADKSNYSAVLDGQQRITSLYIGTVGKYRAHIKGKNWTDASSFYDKYLCLNILSIPGDDDSYEFAFREEDNIGKFIDETEEEETVRKYWVKVNYVCDKNTKPTELAMLPVNLSTSNPGEMTAKQVQFAAETLMNLRISINEKENVNFYPADDMTLAQVVDIFVRVNSGGQKLAASDLMLSVATGEQEDEDFQVKMQEAIETINSATSSPDTAYVADNETVLTAGLMFTGAGNLSLQKKDNYSKATIIKILNKWDEIIEALCNASRYIDYLGFNGKKLTSKNLLLPVAYYFFKNGLKDTHKDSSSDRARCDRVFVRQWILRAMINSVFSDATRSSLLRIRELMDKSTAKYFPLEELMNAAIRKPLTVDEEQIKEILEYKYGDARIIPILTEIAKDYDGRKYDVDHIWPQTKLSNKRELAKLLPGVTEEERDKFKEACNLLPNLEFLTPTANKEKSGRFYDEWVAQAYPDPGSSYYERNCIPNGVSFEFSSFLTFVEKRKELLKVRLQETFPEKFQDIVTRNQLVI